MKTQKSTFSKVTWLLTCLVILPCLSLAQTAPPAPEELEPDDPRPLQTDDASTQLIKNYLTVTGGKQAHRKLANIVATGTIKESTLLRNFKLIETIDGKRHLTYHWTHLGRKHRVIYAYDGLETWTQTLEPKAQEARIYRGTNATHFAKQHWLIQPFTLPTLADHVFKYQGASTVSGRPAHIIKGYGKNDLHSWFYFDKEKSLLTRWGGLGQIASAQEYLDYRATQFKSVNGVLLPSKIDLLAENAAFGHIIFEQIQANQNLSDISFQMPKSKIPTLRQRLSESN